MEDDPSAKVDLREEVEGAPADEGTPSRALRDDARFSACAAVGDDASAEAEEGEEVEDDDDDADPLLRGTPAVWREASAMAWCHLCMVGVTEVSLRKLLLYARARRTPREQQRGAATEFAIRPLALKTERRS